MSQDWSNWDDDSSGQQRNSWDIPGSRQTPQGYGYSGGQDYYSQQQGGGYYGGGAESSFGQQPSYGQQPPAGYGTGPQAGYGFANAQQFMSEPMISAAKQFGGQFAEEQKQKLTKYLGAFNLKYYFAVDNAYVGKKLGILLFPFFHRDWNVRHGHTDEPVPAREDVNAPDLYIPLMAFLTYILVSGFVLGTQGKFSPEQLGILTSNAFIWIILENSVVMVSKYVMNISQALSFWHSLAYSTYKFVGMILCLIMFIAGGKTFYYSTLAYTSLALVFFLLRTVKNFVLDMHSSYNHEDGRKRKLILILFILISQPFIMWWLTSGVTSYEASKYDFARMAMKGMGLGGKAEVPLTDSGEVDYEALLKMPK